MPSTKVFEPIDAMDIRKQLGSFLNKVDLTQQRYIIQRRGAPKALLVPIDDQQAIEETLKDKNAELDTMYRALESICGIIDDPNGADASQTIDDWVYGEAGDV